MGQSFRDLNTNEETEAKEVTVNLFRHIVDLFVKYK